MKKSMFVAAVLVVAVSLVAVNAFAAPEKPTVKASEARQIRPKEVKIDRNYDGVIDRIEVYDTKGLITRVEADVNGDGKIDETVHYENGIPVKGEKDANGDGKPETILVYDNKGAIIRSETDSNGDGKLDEWVTYSNGAPVKAEKDTNNDGKADTWINY